jgi:hypothetical protein
MSVQVMLCGVYANTFNFFVHKKFHGAENFRALVFITVSLGFPKPFLPVPAAGSGAIRMDLQPAHF